MGYYSKPRIENLTVPNYIGVGIADHDVFQTHGCRLNTGDERITQSIRVILSTPIGSRFFQPTFGSYLYTLLFEGNDEKLASQGVFYIKDALKNWETRIDVLEVKCVKQQDRASHFTIIYKRKDTNDIFTYVYPIVRQPREVT